MIAKWSARILGMLLGAFLAWSSTTWLERLLVSANPAAHQPGSDPGCAPPP